MRRVLSCSILFFKFANSKHIIKTNETFKFLDDCLYLIDGAFFNFVYG